MNKTVELVNSSTHRFSRGISNIRSFDKKPRANIDFKNVGRDSNGRWGG